MPSWPSRLLSPPNNPAPEHLSVPSPPLRLPTAGSGGVTSHGRSRSYQIPSSSRSGLASANRGSDRHLNNRRSEGDLLVSTERDGERNRYLGGYKGMSPGMTGGGGSMQTEFTTGRCFCCDSSVRWPTALSVFRCTTCTTINDLRPIEKAAVPGSAPGPKVVLPISAERTRAILGHSVEEFIETKRQMQKVPKHPPPPPPIPIPGKSSNKAEGGNTPDEKISRDDATPPSYPEFSPPTFTTMDAFVVSIPPNPQRRPSLPILNFSGSLSSAGNRRSAVPVGAGSVAAGLNSEEKYHYSEAGSRKSGTPKANNSHEELVKKVFGPLEDYLTTAFTSCDCLNASFLKRRSGDGHPGSKFSDHEPPLPQTFNTQTKTSGASRRSNEGRPKDSIPVTGKIGEKEAILLQRGRFIGKEMVPSRSEKERHKSKSESKSSVRNPGIDWESVDEFYDMVINVGLGLASGKPPMPESNDEKAGARNRSAGKMPCGGQIYAQITAEIEEARDHIAKILLKATESLLRRPGRPLKRPEDVRFLLIVLANPLLYPESARPTSKLVYGMSSSPLERLVIPTPYLKGQAYSSSNRAGGSTGGPGSHSGIIKRIMGLLSNLPNECHHYLVSWFTRMPELQFRRLVELVGSFVTYRLTRQPVRKRSQGRDDLMGLGVKQLPYNDDWQIKAAARVMSLFFSANNNTAGRRGSNPGIKDEGNMNSAVVARREAWRRGQIILTSEFYNMLLDYHDLIADFDAWESRSSKFCFCQYPFLLSMGSKIQILEHDAKRQMEVQARQAFFNSISSRRAVNQYLVLKVRRECLVEDSLRGISEGVGGIDDIKKGLRIEFLGEDGVDAGGLKKEWFLLVARDVFDPNYGMFVYDEDSDYCYFNPHSLESSEEFFLVGVLLGLAIYNSTILDVALPPYVFKKLLHLTSKHILATSSVRPPLVHTLEDLAVFRPALASGLAKLLEFEGDVEITFCRDFVAESERFGEIIHTPLCTNGENKPVTNANRKEFVDLYLKWILDTSIARQFEPFKRGFYTVCGGNALSLFRPEEIELLIRGSDEALDVSAMKAVAIYEGWGNSTPADNDPVVRWFWNFFEKITPKEQRMLLHFITGSDRIPAMGATSLIIKLCCLGQDCDRFPVARTCFNQICLWRYKRREKLEAMIWRAVTDSEGFGLK